MKFKNQIRHVLDKICRSDVATQWTKGFKFEADRMNKGAYESLWRVPSGFSSLDVEKQVDALCAACGAIVEVVNKAGVVLIRVFPEDLPALIPFHPKMVTGLSPKDLLLGFDRLGERITHSLDHDNPHILIAGETGWGKTEVIRLVTFCLISQYTPEECEIFIIDMKGFSFLPFKSVPHIVEIARNLPEAESLLSRSVKEMADRSDAVWESGNRNSTKRFKQRFIIVDEASRLAPSEYGAHDAENRESAKNCDRYLTALAAIGREAGIHVIYCTQYPTAKIVNSQVKMNCGGRICFHVASKVNSQVVLDADGGEMLKHKGRAIYKSRFFQTIQVPYLMPLKNAEGVREEKNDSAWEKILMPYKVEVVNVGQSARKPQAKNIVDVEHGSSSDHAANSTPLVQRQLTPDQAGIRAIDPPREIEASRVEPIAHHSEGVEADEDWEDGDEDDLDVTL